MLTDYWYQHDNMMIGEDNFMILITIIVSSRKPRYDVPTYNLHGTISQTL